MVCKKCGEADSAKFYKTNKSTCKKCASASGCERYRALSDADKIIYKERSRSWQTNNIFRQRFLAAKNRAKSKAIEFNISKDYIETMYHNQKGRCFYSGIEMSKELNDKFVLSLDRIDSKLGYIEGNVVLACSIINSMKLNIDTEEFIRIVRVIYEHQQPEAT